MLNSIQVRLTLCLALLLFLPGAWAARIVSLAPNWSHTVSAIGAEDELVGVTRYARFPQSIPDKVAKGELAVVGGFTDIDPNVVAALKPDLALTASGLQLGLKAELEKRGIKVIHMEESSLAEVYAKIRALGEAIGHQPQAAALVDSIRAGLDKVASEYAGDAPLTVYYEINYLYKCVPGADSYISELIRLVGGEPVFAERAGMAPAVTWTEVVQSDPQVILLPTWPGATGPVFDGPQAGSGTTTVAEVQGRPGAERVMAVQQHQVKFIDSAVTKQAGPSIVKAARLLAEAIHGN